MLPRGKLKRDEDPVVGARREVVEETGHRVRVHEFLGAITYRARGRPKVVQFWRMQAYERPSRDVMSDIVAVEWLPLAAAVRRLSYPLEKLFLQYAGRQVLKRRKRAAKKKKRTRRKAALKPQRRQKSASARRTRKTRAHARKPSPPRARAAKTRGSARRARPRRVKRGAAMPVRVAAAKQASATKVALPAHAAVPRRPSGPPCWRACSAGSGAEPACRIAAASLAKI